MSQGAFGTKVTAEMVASRLSPDGSVSFEMRPSIKSFGARGHFGKTESVFCLPKRTLGPFLAMFGSLPASIQLGEGTRGRAPSARRSACGRLQQYYCYLVAQTQARRNVLRLRRVFFSGSGSGSKLTSQGCAGFGLCFHLPGFHFGTGFLSHTQVRTTAFFTEGGGRSTSIGGSPGPIKRSETDLGWDKEIGG